MRRISDRVRGAAGAAAAGRQAGLEVRARVVHREGPGGRKTTELWLEIAKSGYLGVNIPEEHGGGGGGIGDLAAVCEELAAAGCPLLLMVVSPAICGTVISRFGTDEQKQRWLPGICRRHRHDGVRDHRARRRHQHARASPPRPAATATSGCSAAARSTSPASTSPTPCWSSRAPRTRAPAGSSPACSWCRPTPPGFECQPDRDGDRQRPSSSSPSSSTTCGSRRDALVGRRGRRAGAAVRRAQPRAHHGRVVLQRARPVRAGQGGGVRQGARGLRQPDRRAPGRRAPARPVPTSRSSWPG